MNPIVAFSVIVSDQEKLKLHIVDSIEVTPIRQAILHTHDLVIKKILKEEK